MRKLKGFMPYDPVTEIGYVNSIGSTEHEAGVNVQTLDLSDEVFERLIYEPIDISWLTQPQDK